MSVGERIAELRKQRNISQYEMAKLLDVSRQAVSKWENDLSAPDTMNLIQLADVLDTDVEFLATGNHSKIKSPPEVITMIRPVERVVEKVVEKPIVVEKVVEIERIVEVEKPVETIVEKPVIKKVHRVRYIRNPIEFVSVGILCFLLGVLIGYLL